MKTKQNMAALQYGNSVRLLMSDEKRRVRKDGLPRVIAMLTGGRAPHHVERMRLGDLLRALPRMGPARAMRIIRLANISASAYDTRLEDLSIRERLALAVALRDCWRTRAKRAELK